MPVFSHVLLLKDGRVLASGGKADVLTAKNLSLAFAAKLKLQVKRGRYAMQIVNLAPPRRHFIPGPRTAPNPGTRAVMADRSCHSVTVAVKAGFSPLRYSRYSRSSGSGGPPPGSRTAGTRRAASPLGARPRKSSPGPDGAARTGWRPESARSQPRDGLHRLPARPAERHPQALPAILADPAAGGRVEPERSAASGGSSTTVVSSVRLTRWPSNVSS